MLRNYFKIMVRNLFKRKVFTIINLLGLSTGIAVCLLLALYIQNEIGYDNFHDRGDRIYQLAMERKYPGRSLLRAGIPQSIGQAAKMEFPEIQESCRVMSVDPGGVSVVVEGDKVFVDKEVYIADSNFFRVFSGKAIDGDLLSALEKPGTVVLNETTAKRYFGSAANAMGKSLAIYLQKYVVSAVCRDWPEKSHLKFNLLFSMASFPNMSQPEYVYFGPHTYLLLKEQASAAALEAKLPLIISKYAAARIEPLFGEPYDKFIAEGNGYRYFLQPLKDIHLRSTLEDDFRPSGSIQSIRIFSVIAIFVLFLACINFINLSTALSLDRAREVGIRKTFGSQKRALVAQFLTESIVFSLTSTLAALLLAFAGMPLLSRVAGQVISFGYLTDPVHLLIIVGIAVAIGVTAGLYPALVMSSFEPVTVLKGRFKSNKQGVALRNGLVIFQFAVSVILIISTLVVNKQMQYALGEKLGFKRDHIIVLDRIWQLRYPDANGNFKDRSEPFIQDLSQIAGVQTITKCSAMPGSDELNSMTWVSLENNNSRTQNASQVDENYLNLLHLELKEGRFFSRSFTTDSFSVILNESAARDFNLINPIGAKLVSKEDAMNPAGAKNPTIFTVVGVVRDYHYQTLYKKVAPLILINANKFGFGTLGISISNDHFKSSIAEMEKAWKRYQKDGDLHFSFLDQNLAEQYKSGETEQRLFSVFSLLAIVIACVGLFGLATFSTLQRMKEISVRKVLGAMPQQIIILLSKDFLRLVGIASALAFPVAGYIMHRWLDNFAYRTDISWWIYVLAGGIAGSIALITISYHSIKAAFVNPLNSLKSE